VGGRRRGLHTGALLQTLHLLHLVLIPCSCCHMTQPEPRGGLVSDQPDLPLELVPFSRTSREVLWLGLLFKGVEF
jgi:hypothetical protein